MNVWHCECGRTLAPLVARCRCGREKPRYTVAAGAQEQLAAPKKPPKSRKMAKSERVPAKDWPRAEQGALKIAQRFGVDKKED